MRFFLLAAGVFAFAVLGGAGCAALKAGWAKVEYLDGIAPVMVCTFRIGAEGDVLATCAPLNKGETDLFWQREKKRTQPHHEKT